jgi:hypothetical protein
MTRHSLTLLAAALLATPALSAQSERGGFVVRLGTDTAAVESFVRTGDRIEGWIARRSPVPNLTRYVITLNADNSVASFEQQAHRPDGTPAPNQPTPLTMTFTGDSVIRNTLQNQQPATLRAAAPRGTVATLAFSRVNLSLLVAAARTHGAAHAIGFGAQQQAPARQDVRFFGTDSAEIVAAGFRTGLKLDARGGVIRLDGSLTTQKFIGTVDDAVDARVVAQRWAVAEASGIRVSTASARDTTRATLGAVNVLIDYGRPAKRGREIWGALVPFDTTWRLGANAATTLRTDGILEIGSATIPAGTYTLFLLPTRGSAQLIVNRQTGQWGTAYDAAQDLVRIPMSWHADLGSFEERFAIKVEGNQLVLHWDRGGYTTTIRAK